MGQGANKWGIWGWKHGQYGMCYGKEETWTCEVELNCVCEKLNSVLLEDERCVKGRMINVSRGKQE